MKEFKLTLQWVANYVIKGEQINHPIDYFDTIEESVDFDEIQDKYCWVISSFHLCRYLTKKELKESDMYNEYVGYLMDIYWRTINISPKKRNKNLKLLFSHACDELTRLKKSFLKNCPAEKDKDTLFDYAQSVFDIDYFRRYMEDEE